MSKYLHSPGMPQAAEDDYELQASGGGHRSGGEADEPLLPRYERKPAGSSSSSSIHQNHGTSPHQALQNNRRRSRACGVFWCLWAFFVPLVLGLALVGCYFGRKTLDNVRGWEAWEGVPQEVKDWLESVAPPSAEQQTGYFPTQ